MAYEKVAVSCMCGEFLRFPEPKPPSTPIGSLGV
jgi:hypothetical protein